MDKEVMKKLLADVKNDLGMIESKMGQQKLMGGLKAEHILQFIDVKAILALTVCLKILEELSKEEEPRIIQ